MVPVLPVFECPLCGSKSLEVRPTAANAATVPTSSSSSSSLSSAFVVDESSANAKFSAFLRHADVDVDVLRETIRMNGMCDEFRALSWQLMLSYSTPKAASRALSLRVHRSKYFMWVAEFFRPESNLMERQRALKQQIAVDVPRTNCRTDSAYFENTRLADSLTRVLFIWSAVVFETVGYFQGLNEDAMPLYMVLLDARARELKLSGNNTDEKVALFPNDEFNNLEADVFWCLVRLMEPVVRGTGAAGSKVHAIEQTRAEEAIVRVIDPNLCHHLDDLGVDWMFFSFRWNVCFLLRELGPSLVKLVWDYYLLDDPESGFVELHVFCCCALLLRFRNNLMQITDTTEALMFLQSLPTEDWTEADVRDLVASAVTLRNPTTLPMVAQFKENLRTKPALDVLDLVRK